MKIVAVMGTYRKNGAGAGYLRQLQQAAGSGVEWDIVWLGDCNLQLCRGCMVCYERSETACPLRDEYLAAMERLNSADAAVFYSPTFTVSITGLMKTFFDRSSYVLHRPYFAGRRALVLTSATSWGESTAKKTLQHIVSLMGFSVVDGLSVVNLRYEGHEAYRRRVNGRLGRMARLLLAQASCSEPIRPTLMELIVFQYQKRAFGPAEGSCRADRQFWRQAGWTRPEAAYYCPARVSPLRRRLAQGIAALVRGAPWLSR